LTLTLVHGLQPLGHCEVEYLLSITLVNCPPPAAINTRPMSGQACVRAKITRFLHKSYTEGFAYYCARMWLSKLCIHYLETSTAPRQEY